MLIIIYSIFKKFSYYFHLYYNIGSSIIFRYKFLFYFSLPHLLHEQVFYDFQTPYIPYETIKLNNKIYIISLNSTDSTSVSISSILVNNGTLDYENQTNGIYYAKVNTLQIELTNIDEISISGLEFLNITQLTKNLISINNCRNITLSYCNFSLNKFNSPAESTGYYIVLINETNIFDIFKNKTTDTIEIVNNIFYQNTFAGNGSALYFYNNSESTITIQNNSFTNNNEDKESVILGAYVRSTFFTVENNYFFNNSLIENGGGVLQFNSPKCQILFFGNEYILNSAPNGNGSCIYVSNEQEEIIFLNETFVSNIAYCGGSLFFIYENSSLYIENCTFDNNSAYWDGGAINIYNTSGEIMLTQNNFTSNSAVDEGGTMFIYRSSAEISMEECYHFNNSAEYKAGSVYIEESTAELIFNQTNFVENFAPIGGTSYLKYIYSEIDYLQCEFINNSALKEGGAIEIDYLSSTVNFTSCLFLLNEGGINGLGGAVGFYYGNGAVLMYQSNFTENTAGGGGSLYFYGNEFQISIINCEHFNNSAIFWGGSIYASPDSGMLTIAENNFTENSAGLILNETSTIADQEEYGGAIYLWDFSNSINFTENVFDSNISPNGGAVSLGLCFDGEYDNQNPIINLTSNYFENNTSAFGGAIEIEEGLCPTYLESNIYENNEATNTGGAVFIETESEIVEFLNESYFLNQAGLLGGAVAIQQCSNEFIFEEINFTENSASNGGGIFIENEEGIVNSIESNFFNNTAIINGAAVFVEICQSSFIVEENIFTSNTAETDGGSIYAFDLLQGIIITDSYFTDSYAGSSGGAISLVQIYEEVLFYNLSFIASEAFIGGAINIEKPENNINIEYCEFYNSVANQYGGAIALVGEISQEAILNISLSAFSENTAIVQSGGDLYLEFFESASFYSNTHEGSEGAVGGSVYLLNLDSVYYYNISFFNSSSFGEGSAVYVSEASTFSGSEISIENCSGNQGTVYLDEISSVYMTDTLLDSNIVSGSGGGLIIYESSTTILINFTMENNYASSNAGALMLENIADLIITNLSCINNEALAGNGGCLSILNSELILLNGSELFDQNSAGQLGGAIYFLNPVQDYLLLEEMIIENNEANEGGGIAIVNSAEIAISINKLTLINNEASYEGGAIYVSSSLATEQFNFDFDEFTEQEGFISSNCSQVYINSSLFSNNIAEYGGALAILESSVVIISNSYFETNEALSEIYSAESQEEELSGGGGAIYLCDVQYVWISNVNCQNNLAITGGAIYQTNANFSGETNKYIYLNSNIFSENSAVEEGGAINIEYNFEVLQILNCDFQNNTAFVAGAVLLSVENVQQNDEQQESRITEISNSGPAVLNITANRFLDNSASNNAEYAEDVRIVVNSLMEEAQSNQIETQLAQENNFSNYGPYSISLGCEAGEEQDLTTNQCTACTIGQYSQGGYASECISCPQHSQCFGNYTPIKVEAGYWRANVSSLNIIECVHTSSQCLGGDTCATGYSGLLCEECDYEQGYARGSAPFTCEKCNIGSNILILTIVGLLFSTALILLVLYGNINFRNEELRDLFAQKVCKHLITLKDNSPALTRALIGHAQVLTIIFKISINYPQKLVYFYTYFSEFTEVLSNQLVCVFGAINELPPAYSNVIYNHIEVLIVFLLLLIILSGLHYYKVLVFKEQIKSFTLNMLIFFLPGMFNQLLALLSQRSVDEITDQTFTIYELGIVWGSKEFYYSYKLVLPLLFFWLGVFAWVVYMIFKNGKFFYEKNKIELELRENENDNNETLLHNNQKLSKRSIFTYNYGNLFIGYTEERYYWEAVMMAVKLVLIVIQNVFSETPIVVTSFSILILLIIMALELESTPYVNLTVKKLSDWCLFIEILTLTMLQIMYTESEGSGLFYFTFIVMIIFNYGMFIFLVKNLLVENYKKIVEIVYRTMVENNLPRNESEKYSAFVQKYFKEKLINLARKRQITNYGWNIVLNTAELMIEEMRERQRLKEFSGELISSFSQQENSIAEINEYTCRCQNDIDISKESLLKIVFDDWKREQKSTTMYKFYTKWRELRGQKIEDELDLREEEQLEELEMVEIDMEIESVQQKTNEISLDDQASLGLISEQQIEKNPGVMLLKSQIRLSSFSQQSVEEMVSPIITGNMKGIHQDSLESRDVLEEQDENYNNNKDSSEEEEQQDNLTLQTPKTNIYKNLFQERSVEFDISEHEGEKKKEY